MTYIIPCPWLVGILFLIGNWRNISWKNYWHTPTSFMARCCSPAVDEQQWLPSSRCAKYCIKHVHRETLLLPSDNTKQWLVVKRMCYFIQLKLTTFRLRSLFFFSSWKSWSHLNFYLLLQVNLLIKLNVGKETESLSQKTTSIFCHRSLFFPEPLFWIHSICL